jgi:hypothetical protein
MLEEMKSAWEKYDVLVTAGAGPAPALSPRLAKWPSLNRFSPFALLAAPALVVPSGYSRDGLPLSIQFIAKPFDDARLLGIAHAYEQATGFWCQREPVLPNRAPPPAIDPPESASIDESDPQIVNLCERAAINVGLRLSETHLAILCRAAPHLIEMLQGVRGAAGSAEPANVLFVPSA